MVDVIFLLTKSTSEDLTAEVILCHLHSTYFKQCFEWMIKSLFVDDEFSFLLKSNPLVMCALLMHLLLAIYDIYGREQIDCIEFYL